MSFAKPSRPAVIAGVQSNCRAGTVTFALIIIVSNVFLQSVSSAALWLRLR